MASKDMTEEYKGCTIHATKYGYKILGVLKHELKEPAAVDPFTNLQRAKLWIDAHE